VMLASYNLLLSWQVVYATSSPCGLYVARSEQFAFTCSGIASQSFTSGSPSAPSPGTCPSYLNFAASFHMASHFTHLSSLRPRHITAHTANGSPLSVAGQSNLCSDSFHVPDISLVFDLTMQLMYAGQITDHDYRVILDRDFFYIQDCCTGHLVGTGPRRRDSQHFWEFEVESL
jgi:hypothetical protein